MVGAVNAPSNLTCLSGGLIKWVDDTDDELYEQLMDDNESNAISDLLVYLENVPPPVSPSRFTLPVMSSFVCCLDVEGGRRGTIANVFISKRIGSSLIAMF